ncbi:immunity 49 family protein [Streptomyces sp. N2-109]|uniref:Immunity 49 family protein n=1 Tax=Streptomyces gossypii TaxID=2883101 RepID=A0ABT2JNS7_9ACTN|nr:immunity 49 family protein [Streptomyces gossypii]MCT2589542.1 immunity 49 family protein [Streptomyces gossypii]
MQEVACHRVGEERIAEALEGIHGRTIGHWHDLRYGDGTLQELRDASADLLDHVGACTGQDPALEGASVRLALRTAAECTLGVLSLGCFPDGDQEIPFPLIGEELTSEQGIILGYLVDQAPTTSTWLDSFGMCLISGLVWERNRVIGLLLREDYAPAIRDGVPYSRLESRSDPAGLAEMDALCGYLTQASGHLPRDWPSITLRKPDAGERFEAARRLDALSELTPDQRLLRVLLEDDQSAFEQALAGRLVQHRESEGGSESAASGAAPRSLLPVGAIALAALAVQVHGWELRIRSGYLPEGLLRAPEGAPQVGV